MLFLNNKHNFRLFNPVIFKKKKKKIKGDTGKKFKSFHLTNFIILITNSSQTSNSEFIVSVLINIIRKIGYDMQLFPNLNILIFQKETKTQSL